MTNQARKAPLSYELRGVIIDVEQGAGFDAVCLETIKHVCAALANQEARAAGEPVAWLYNANEGLLAKPVWIQVKRDAAPKYFTLYALTKDQT